MSCCERVGGWVGGVEACGGGGVVQRSLVATTPNPELKRNGDEELCTEPEIPQQGAISSNIMGKGERLNLKEFAKTNGRWRREFEEGRKSECCRERESAVRWFCQVRGSLQRLKWGCSWKGKLKGWSFLGKFQRFEAAVGADDVEAEEHNLMAELSIVSR